VSDGHGRQVVGGEPNITNPEGTTSDARGQSATSTAESGRLADMSAVRKGAQGGQTSSVEVSPAKAKQRRAALRRQESRWAAKAGPVEIRRVLDDANDVKTDAGPVAATAHSQLSTPAS
jgi:hypothetical protein